MKNADDIWLSLVTTRHAVARSASAIKRSDKLIQQLDAVLIRKLGPDDEAYLSGWNSSAHFQVSPIRPEVSDANSTGPAQIG